MHFIVLDVFHSFLQVRISLEDLLLIDVPIKHLVDLNIICQKGASKSVEDVEDIVDASEMVVVAMCDVNLANVDCREITKELSQILQEQLISFWVVSSLYHDSLGTSSDDEAVGTTESERGRILSRDVVDELP